MTTPIAFVSVECEKLREATLREVVKMGWPLAKTVHQASVVITDNPQQNHFTQENVKKILAINPCDNLGVAFKKYPFQKIEALWVEMEHHPKETTILFVGEGGGAEEISISSSVINITPPEEIIYVIISSPGTKTPGGFYDPNERYFPSRLISPTQRPIPRYKRGKKKSKSGRGRRKK